MKIKEKQGRNSISDININYHDDVVTKGTIPEPETVEKPPIENLQVKPIMRFNPQTFQKFEAQPQPKARKVNNLYSAQNTSFKQLQKTLITCNLFR